MSIDDVLRTLLWTTQTPLMCANELESLWDQVSRIRVIVRGQVPRGRLCAAVSDAHVSRGAGVDLVPVGRQARLPRTPPAAGAPTAPTASVPVGKTQPHLRSHRPGRPGSPRPMAKPLICIRAGTGRHVRRVASPFRCAEPRDPYCARPERKPISAKAGRLRANRRRRALALNSRAHQVGA